MSDEQQARFHVWRGRYFDEIDLSLMTPMQTAAYKSAFQAGLQARDAEVQALRKALKDARFLIGKLAGWQGMDLSELDDEYDGVITRTSAALAGGKGSSDD